MNLVSPSFARSSSAVPDNRGEQPCLQLSFGLAKKAPTHAYEIEASVFSNQLAALGGCLAHPSMGEPAAPCKGI